MSILFGFVSKYFMEGIMVIALAIITKVARKYLSNDKIDKIKEGILEAMLYAEEALGIGHGNEKWTLAWRVLVKILKKQGITLNESEQEQAKTLMKATVPEINQITYSTLPKSELISRHIHFRNDDTTLLVEKLKRKHAIGGKNDKSNK